MKLPRYITVNIHNVPVIVDTNYDATIRNHHIYIDANAFGDLLDKPIIISIVDNDLTTTLKLLAGQTVTDVHYTQYRTRQFILEKQTDHYGNIKTTYRNAITTIH